MVKISVLLSFVFLIAFGFVVHGSSATKEVGVYEIKKGNFSVKFTNWGATIISVILPDKNGMIYTYKKSLVFFFFLFLFLVSEFFGCWFFRKAWWCCSWLWFSQRLHGEYSHTFFFSLSFFLTDKHIEKTSFWYAKLHQY